MGRLLLVAFISLCMIFLISCTPKTCCRALTAECLSCADGVSIDEYCADSPETVGCPVHDDLFVSLDEEFTLHVGQRAIIPEENLSLGVKQFHNSPCGGVCVWSGVGISFEYVHDGETARGINLVRAFGFETTIVETDYETYAVLKIGRIV